MLFQAWENRKGKQTNIGTIQVRIFRYQQRRNSVKTFQARVSGTNEMPVVPWELWRTGHFFVTQIVWVKQFNVIQQKIQFQKLSRSH